MIILFAISLMMVIAGIIISIINEVFIDGNFKIFKIKIFKISAAIILIGFVFFETLAFYMLFNLRG